MTQRRPTLQADYFEAIYRRDPDPWHFRTSGYEADKYAATLDCLTRPRYRRALEVGCSIGVFTRLLAPRCEALLSIDVSDSALDIARQDCADLPHVEFRRAAVPAEFPAGRFDLIVLSEVLYYLAQDDLRRVADRVVEALEPGGDVVLCHWLGESDYPLSGDEAAASFLEATLRPFPFRYGVRKPEYRLDRLSAESPESRGETASTATGPG